MYQERDDWDGDDNRHNTHVHYRLYLNQAGEPTVICVQDFDYVDYDARRILSAKAWTTQAEAEQALADLLPVIALVDRQLPTFLGSGLRARMVAATIRQAELDPPPPSPVEVLMAPNHGPLAVDPPPHYRMPQPGVCSEIVFPQCPPQWSSARPAPVRPLPPAIVARINAGLRRFTDVDGIKPWTNETRAEDA